MHLLATTTFLVLLNTISGQNAEDTCSLAPSFSIWYKHNLDTFKPGNPHFIEEIPNPLCNLMTESVSIGCKDCNSKLQHWYLSHKCMTACNEHNCAPYEDLMVECIFSFTNRLEEPVEDVEWSAKCTCPANTKHAGEEITIPDTTYAQMLEAYNAHLCDDVSAVGCAGTVECDPFACTTSTINWCDHNAACTPNENNRHGYNCNCNTGFTGNGYDCSEISASAGAGAGAGAIAPLEPAPVQDWCDDKVFDILFIVDGSGSVYPPEKFVTLQTFVKSIIAWFTIGAAKSHVAYMQFSSDYTLNFNFSQYFTPEELYAAIDSIVQLDNQTYLGHAITAAKDLMLIPEQGRRVAEKGVIFVLTEGETNDDPTDAAAALKTAGYDIWAVGIGPNVNETVLLTIASDAAHLIRPDHFDVLPNFVDALVGGVCGTGP